MFHRDRDGVPIMIKHERLILEKLTENPMLSQGELAAMLNLTRSSISVYISHLMQMGYIRGRGIQHILQLWTITN